MPCPTGTKFTNSKPQEARPCKARFACSRSMAAALSSARKTSSWKTVGVTKTERTPQRIFGHRRFGVRAPSTFGVLHPTACSSADGISPPASSRRTFAATRMLPTSWLSRSQYGSGSPRGQRRRVLQPHSSPLTEPPAHAAGTLPALKLPAKGFKYVFPFSRNSMVSSSFLGIPRLCTSALCLCFKHRQAMLNL